MSNPDDSNNELQNDYELLIVPIEKEKTEKEKIFELFERIQIKIDQLINKNK